MTIVDIFTGKPVTPESNETAISLELKRLAAFVAENKIKSYAIVMIDENGAPIIGHDLDDKHYSIMAAGLWSVFNEMADLAMDYEDFDDLEELDFED